MKYTQMRKLEVATNKMLKELEWYSKKVCEIKDSINTPSINDTIRLRIDKKNPLYCDDETMMNITVAYHVNYLSDLLKKQGYIYTNLIYETFNVVWYPTLDNDVFLYKNFEKFSYTCEIDTIDNKSFITVTIKGESR